MNRRHGLALLGLMLLLLLPVIRAAEVSSGSLVLADESQDGKKPKNPRKPRKTNVGRKMKTCGKCHMDVKAEWGKSGHSRAWSNPVFQGAIADRDDGGDACARCHAPASILETGAGNVPRARDADRELGVNCLSCHVKGKQYFGPIPSEGHKGIQVSQEYRESKWCQSCHGQPELSQHDHFSSYSAGPAATEGSTCQKCHMPEVVRQLASSKKRLKKLQPAQKCRQHLFAIPAVDGEIQGAVAIEGRFDGGKLVIALKPHGGHSLLVGPDLSLLLEVRTLGANGEETGEPQIHKFNADDDPELLRCAPQDVTFDCPSEVSKVRAAVIRVRGVVPGRASEDRQILAMTTVSR